VSKKPPRKKRGPLPNPTTRPLPPNRPPHPKHAPPTAATRAKETENIRNSPFLLPLYDQRKKGKRGAPLIFWSRKRRKMQQTTSYLPSWNGKKGYHLLWEERSSSAGARPKRKGRRGRSLPKKKGKEELFLSTAGKREEEPFVSTEGGPARVLFQHWEGEETATACEKDRFRLFGKRGKRNAE